MGRKRTLTKKELIKLIEKSYKNNDDIIGCITDMTNLSNGLINSNISFTKDLFEYIK